ncbi:MAG: hypothetical protein IT189_09855 [Microbacteriaceae bacterium]|nr:hypothetical protein [Microbacteriaceae bacterium]
MRQLPVNVVVHMTAHRRTGDRVWTTVIIPVGDHVMILNTREREENQR